MDLYIGIDLGTSSVKLMLVDGEGEIKNTVTREYPVCYPRSGWSEQNAEDWWRAFCDAIPELLDGFDGQSVKGIGVAGQIVAYCIEQNKVLETMTLDEYLKFDDRFDNEVYGAIDLKNCVERRISEGGTSVASVEAQIEAVKKSLNL